jgi:hypothetical protein
VSPLQAAPFRMRPTTASRQGFPVRVGTPSAFSLVAIPRTLRVRASTRMRSIAASAETLELRDFYGLSRTCICGARCRNVKGGKPGPTGPRARWNKLAAGRSQTSVSRARLKPDKKKRLLVSRRAQPGKQGAPG